MKVRSTGKLNKGLSRKAGNSTLEILIAFAVLTLCMTAVIMIGFGNQSVSVDTQTNNEALSQAEKILEDARANARTNFLGVISYATTSTSTIAFNQKLDILDISECKKQATSTVSWSYDSRIQTISLTTFLSSTSTVAALGGDCPTDAPSGDWHNPKPFATDTINPGKSTAIDVLNRMVYVGSDHDPYFLIASTTYATLGQSNGLFVTFSNGFNASSTINSLDSIHDSNTGKNYVFAAMSSSTQQLLVIDVTNIYKPKVVASRGLSSCVSGSAPQGWRVYYYGKKLYLTTRFTSGPEFHIFDVSDPTNPSEYSIGSVACKGLKLGDTVNNLVVKDQNIAGITRRFAYLATDEVDKELRVLDVTNPPTVTEVLTANQDLPGAQNGLSVFSVGNKLYLGRQSTPGGADLYIYDISNPNLGLTLLGSKDINTGVLSIRVAGKYAFLATPKSNQEFQVWDISSTTNITNIAIYNFGNIVDQGLDYEPDYVYSTGQATPNLQILYSAP